MWKKICGRGEDVDEEMWYEKMCRSGCRRKCGR
jgi:hypothetical protein